MSLGRGELNAEHSLALLGAPKLSLPSPGRPCSTAPSLMGQQHPPRVGEPIHSLFAEPAVRTCPKA